MTVMDSCPPTGSPASPMTRKRALVADAHSSVRELVEMGMTLEGSCQVVGHAGCGTDLLDKLNSDDLEILILDPKLPDISGADIIRRVRKEHRQVRILVFSGASNREVMVEMLEAHPHGFAHKEEPLRVFYDVLRAVVGGSRCYSEYGVRLMETSGDQAARIKTPLSPREKDVLRLLALGRSSKEIAFKLSLAIKTVDHYRATLMTKLGIHEVAGLTRYAVGAGMVSAEG